MAVFIEELMRKEQREAAARAPRKPAGTQVTVRAHDVIESITGLRLPEFAEKLTPDHMYVEYDDGREKLIASGGGDQFTWGRGNRLSSAPRTNGPLNLLPCVSRGRAR